MEDIVENGSLDKKQRIDVVKSFFMASDFEIIDIKENAPFTCFSVRRAGRTLSLYLLLKNIVNSGWSNKPYIKRIQIMSLANVDVPHNSGNTYSILLGIGIVNGQPIVCVWNPFLFVFHKSNRSCYVLVKSLALCHHVGFYSTNDSGNDLLLSDKNNFGKLIFEYIDRYEVQ